MLHEAVVPTFNVLISAPGIIRASKLHVALVRHVDLVPCGAVIEPETHRPWQCSSEPRHEDFHLSVIESSIPGAKSDTSGTSCQYVKYLVIQH